MRPLKRKGRPWGGRPLKQLGLVLFTAVYLCACAADRTQLTAADSNRCESYGFKPGTDSFAQCMMQADIQRRDHQEQRRRDIINSVPDVPLRSPR